MGYSRYVFLPHLKPIIVGIVSVCERLSEWVDLHLQPLVKRNPGFLQESKEVLKSLFDVKWNKGYSCVTLDAVNLYSCIPHIAALRSIEQNLIKHSQYSKEVCQFLVMTVEFLLKHNFFSFDGKFFLQVEGAPMGSTFSPFLSNLFMSSLEAEYIFSANNPLFGICDMVRVLH